MTPMSKLALDVAVDAAGSQAALCRRLNRPQSTYSTWIAGNGPSPTCVGELVQITEGQCTAPMFREDVFGWLRGISTCLLDDMPDDARLAGIEQTWLQIPTRNLVRHLMENRGWSRKRARDACDFLADNDYVEDEAAA